MTYLYDHHAGEVRRVYNTDGYLGCVSRRRSRTTGTTIAIFHAEQADMDPDGGPWVTFCEEHGTLCNHETLEIARRIAPSGEWCEECMSKGDTR